MDNLYQIQVKRDNNWTETVRLQSAKPLAEILPSDFGLEVSELDVWHVEFLGEIFIRRMCTCGNLVTCVGTWNNSDKSTHITTEVGGKVTGGLRAETIVECLCGRKMRTVNRWKWTNAKIHEMVENAYAQGENLG